LTEKGLDFFDTAERYGASPLSMIPAALAGVGLPVDKSYLGGDCESNLARWGAGSKVATKFTPTPWRRSVQDVVHAAEKSAERLGVQQLDLYQIHMPDIIQPFARFGKTEVKDEIYWDGLIECYKRGLVKNVGVSNYGPTMLARAQEHLAREGVPLASNQIAFNLLTRRQGSQATVDAGNALGIKTLAYYPLAMGLLTGKVRAACVMIEARAALSRRY
jgi:pyridoxine 4-dehydrogenase